MNFIIQKIIALSVVITLVTATIYFFEIPVKELVYQFGTFLWSCLTGHLGLAIFTAGTLIVVTCTAVYLLFWGVIFLFDDDQY
jgi:hypothetical protein